MDNLDNLFSDFLLSMLNESNASLISELRARWKEYMATPVIDFGQPKQPEQHLFTTEDGIKIFKGDSFFIVDSMCRIEKYIAQECHNTGGNSLLKTAFATIDAAEKYVLENKPCLSLNDIEDYLNTVALPSPTNSYIKELRILIKQKLDL